MYQTRLLKRAEFELRIIIHYLSGRSKQGAAHLLAAFETSLHQVSQNPLGYGLAPENIFVDPEIRQFFFKTRRGRVYRTVFTIVKQEIRNLHIRGTGEDLIYEMEDSES